MKISKFSALILETYFKLSYLYWRSQMPGRFVSGNFLGLKSKALNLSRNQVEDNSQFFGLLFHRHFWPSKTVYRNQISLKDFSKNGTFYIYAFH